MNIWLPWLPIAIVQCNRLSLTPILCIDIKRFNDNFQSHGVPSVVKLQEVAKKHFILQEVAMGHLTVQHPQTGQ